MKKGQSLKGADFSRYVLAYLILAVSLLEVSVRTINAVTITDQNWITISGDPQTDGKVYATATDGRGNLYIGGDFTSVGKIFATNVARWDGVAWYPLGGGVGTYQPGNITPNVSALACDSSGNLYVGGNFKNPAGLLTTNLAKWNGASWSALGSGLDGFVFCLTVDSHNNLFVGGAFSHAGGNSIPDLARWNGSWSAVGGGVNGSVVALTSDNLGNVYAGAGYFGSSGGFTMAAGIPVSKVARWDGTNWFALGTGITGKNYNYTAVNSLACDSAANLWVGGDFATAGGSPATNVAMWNGIGWSALGTGLPNTTVVRALVCDDSTNVYVGSGLRGPQGSQAISCLYRWNGSTLNSSGTNSYNIYSLARGMGGDVFAGGDFGVGVAATVARWNSNAWYGLETSINSDAYAMVVDAAGNMYAGGFFDTAEGKPVNHVAKWDGAHWNPLSSGIVGSAPFVNAVAVDTSSNLYVGGTFRSAGGNGATNIARWNGTNWSSLGNGIGNANYGEVYALAWRSGSLYVGGSFTNVGSQHITNIARWNGSAWSSVGTASESVSALAFDNSGTLYAGGGFIINGTNFSGVAKFNGTSWVAVGGEPGGYGEIHALAFDSSGNLYAGGYFSGMGSVAANSIAKWNGSTWSALGTGLSFSYAGTLGGPWVDCLVSDAAGNVFVGGLFDGAGGLTARYIALWDGTQWATLGSGTSNPYSGIPEGEVESMCLDNAGNLFVSGVFTRAGGKPSASFSKVVMSGPFQNQVAVNTGSGGARVISFLGNPGARYAIDFAASLSSPLNWIPQTTNTASTNNAVDSGYITYTNLPASPQGYYRARYVK